MKKPKFTESMNYAVRGLTYALKTERNLKIHISASIIVLLLCLWIDIDKTDLMFILIAISLVLITETVNTSIEAVVNLLTLSQHPLAKIAKDVSAGAVLISVLNALACGYLIIFPAVQRPIIYDAISKIKSNYSNIIIILAVLIVITVFTFKLIGKKGNFLRGGLASGHAALAFAGSTAIMLLTQNLLASALAFFIAVLVSQSRVEAKFHKLVEVIIGGLIGVLFTIVLFALLGR